MRAGPLCAVLAAVAIAAGCGGDEIDSKADFIAAGDRICTERDEQSLELAASEDKDDAPQLTRELAEIYSMTISKIKALALPPGDARAGAEEFVESVDAMASPVQRMKEAADALAATRSAAAIKEAAAELQSTVNTVTAIGDLADLRAREYGFERCGQQRPVDPVA
ncbi:MAG: hypothetical protein ACR2LK_00960 [Solirubrobacteraceae bacterium]